MSKQWIILTQGFEKQCHQFVGRAKQVNEITRSMRYERARGKVPAGSYYLPNLFKV